MIPVVMVLVFFLFGDRSECLSRNFDINNFGDGIVRELRSWVRGEERTNSMSPWKTMTTITRKVPVPYPVTVEKKVPFKVVVKVEKPYPIYVPKPYAVVMERKVPYQVLVPVPKPYKLVKHIPYPVKVEVDRPVPVNVPKPYPFVIEKKVPIIIEDNNQNSDKVPVETSYRGFQEKDRLPFQRLPLQSETSTDNPIEPAAYPSSRREVFEPSSINSANIKNDETIAIMEKLPGVPLWEKGDRYQQYNDNSSSLLVSDVDRVRDEEHIFIHTHIINVTDNKAGQEEKWPQVPNLVEFLQNHGNDPNAVYQINNLTNYDIEKVEKIGDQRVPQGQKNEQLGIQEEISKTLRTVNRKRNTGDKVNTEYYEDPYKKEEVKINPRKRSRKPKKVN